MHKGYSTPLVIAIMAFAVVAFLFLIDTSINPDATRKTTKTNTNGATNQNSNSSANNNNNLIANANTNSSVDSQGVEWKKYANTKNGLSFEYPATNNVLREYENIFEVRVVGESDQDKDKPRSTDGAAGPGSIGIGSYDVLKTDLSAFAREQSGNRATIKNTTVAGQDAVRAEWVLPLDPGQDEIDMYFFNYGGKTWFARFDLTGVDGGAHDQFARLVQSISFDPTAGWKTYTNTTYGYTVQYPGTYRVTPTPNDPESILIESGQAGQAEYYFITIGVVNEPSEDPEDIEDLFTWAKDGFPKDDPITLYHANPRDVTLGGLAFMMTDGDTASSAIPEYLIFHNDTLYRIGSYPRLKQENNRELIATFTFTN